jgi:5-methylcytosine-specific restriction enzyme subunit McrC
MNNPMGGINFRKQEILPLRDNRNGILAVQVPKAISEAGLFEILNRFQDKKLEEWSELGVTVFKGHGKDDGSKKAAVYNLSSEDENRRIKISTSNSMGVIRLRDKHHGGSLQIEIGSRFDTGQNQFFLAYLLSKVFGGSLVDSVDLSKDSLWDMLLAFAFRRLFLEAGKIGLFKQYRTFQHNDMRLRGRIEVARHLRQNVPFQGKVAYATHEISYDNPTNHLIRHALVKIMSKWGWVLSGDSRLARLSREISERTPSWSKNEVFACVAKKENRMPIRHPFFQSAYEPLRKLSLAILREEGAGLYQQKQEAEGVIFDGSWLWEEYVWTLLKKQLGFEHTENKTQLGAWTPLTGITMYPDFFHREKRVVLDAKYQRFGSEGDNYKYNVKQVFGYMLVMDAIHGGLIYPDAAESFSEIIKRQSHSNAPFQPAIWHRPFLKS